MLYLLCIAIIGVNQCNGFIPIGGTHQKYVPQGHRGTFIFSGRHVEVQKSTKQPIQEQSSANTNLNAKNNQKNASNPFAVLDKILYPSLGAPYYNATLPVSSMHNISYYLYGNPEGEPALFLHGGPGAGCFPNHARFFDPSHYQIVLVDQRGCGNSVPRGETQENTLLHLVQDCESMRKHLNIEKWKVVLGGSWGTTLAIAYAQEYPNSVGALVLRGVCLFRTKEIDWLFGDNGGASKLNPEAWKIFADYALQNNTNNTTPISDLEGRKVLYSYYDMLLSQNPEIRLNAAKYWSTWEMNISRLQADKSHNTSEVHGPHNLLVWNGSTWLYQNETDRISETDSQASQKLRKLVSTDVYEDKVPETLMKAKQTCAQEEKKQRAFQYPMHLSKGKKLPIPVQNMLTCYYSVNNSDENEVFGVSLLRKDRMSRIKSIPIIAIQGGLDNICPPDSALDLLQSHLSPENVVLRIPLDAGHSMYNPRIASEIVRATDFFARK